MGYPNAVGTWLVPRLRDDVDNMLDDLEAVMHKAEALRIRAGGMAWVTTGPNPTVSSWRLGEEFRAFLYVERSYQTYSISDAIDYGVQFDTFQVMNRITCSSPLSEIAGHTFQVAVSGYYRYSGRVTFNSTPDTATAPYSLWLRLLSSPDIKIGKAQAIPLAGVDYVEINGVIPIRSFNPDAPGGDTLEMFIRQESGDVMYINHAGLCLEWIGPLAPSGSQTGWGSEYGISDPTYVESTP